MRLVFYAPLKPPDHPVPSGDRRMAQLLMAALATKGHEVELASRFRSLDAIGNPQRQMRLAALGGKLAHRITRRVLARPHDQRPRAWITYHLYYKAPDWLGPRVSAALGIPYVVIEASLAQKRAGGPWSMGHAAVTAALSRANAVVSMHATDEAGVAPVVAHPLRLHRLKPFIDVAPFAAALRSREELRAKLAAHYALPLREPWLLAVAMMRPGDKLASYRVLGRALATRLERPWRLIVVGAGSAESDVRACLAEIESRVVYVGLIAPDAVAPFYAAADLQVWPAINEAYGITFLEGQASALPAVAGNSGGVGEIIRDGRTGWLVPPGDAPAFAAAVEEALANPEQRRARGTAAWAKIAADHALSSAGDALDRILTAALRGVP